MTGQYHLIISLTGLEPTYTPLEMTCLVSHYVSMVTVFTSTVQYQWLQHDHVTV